MPMYEAVSAGHVCVDIIPEFFSGAADARDIFIPGRLIKTGKNSFSTGGSVGNTGIALSKLGVSTALAAKIGDDALGRMTCDLLRALGGDPSCASVREGEDSSYTIVLAPPGVDRIFLHYAAANDTFRADDVDFEKLRGARAFHFGYPTAMRRMAEEGGAELVKILRAAKDMGMTTSLDFSYPDERMIQFDWRTIFENALPYADMVFPSAEELLMMLDPAEYARLRGLDADVLKHLDIDYLPSLGETLLGMGAKIAAIKCGTRGYYLKTAGRDALAGIGGAAPKDPAGWADRELFTHVFEVGEVKSATGAGDTSIAGFLAALLRGHSIFECLDAAAAAGALCVTAHSATGAMLPLEEILDRVRSGWKKRPYDAYRGTHFRYDPAVGMLSR